MKCFDIFIVSVLMSWGRFAIRDYFIDIVSIKKLSNIIINENPNPPAKLGRLEEGVPGM